MSGIKRFDTVSDFKDTIKMTLTTDGNLGVGTINPNYRISVNGTIQANAGSLQAPLLSSDKKVGLTIWDNYTHLTFGIKKISFFNGFIKRDGIIQSILVDNENGIIENINSTYPDLFIQPLGGQTYIINETDYASYSYFSSAKLIVCNADLYPAADFLAKGTETICNFRLDKSSSSQANAIKIILFNSTDNNTITNNDFFIRFMINTSLAGGVKVNGNGVEYVTSSDISLKKDIQPITNALEKILALNPVNFNWINNNTNDNGFIAQEVQTVLPSLVSETDLYANVNPEENVKILTLNEIGMIPFIVGAIKEQQQIINDLKARIEVLENIINNLNDNTSNTTNS